MKLKKNILIPNQSIKIGGSKSITNRLLILHALFDHIKIENASDSEDTLMIREALENKNEIVDIKHAGTGMRFLTAYFAIQKGAHRIITGSERMKQRPIKPLVDALRQLDADIQYVENEGFPPLKIIGKEIEKNSVSIAANISSQYITALMLIGAKLKNGLQIELIGKITSVPYIEMTLKTLQNIGVKANFSKNIIKIEPYKKENNLSSILHFEVESDWSSASYYYSMVAISKKNISLQNFKSNSLQGDSEIKKIYWEFFGVNTIFNSQENQITLIAEPHRKPELIKLDLNHCPDIAQTISVTAAALKIPFEISGLETLKIKETDRLFALKNELYKIGCLTEITENAIKSLSFFDVDDEISIKTYQDHRMAMSFAPYSFLQSIEIQNEEVVEKSYPNFWKDFSKITHN